MRNKKLVSDLTLDGLFIAILAILTFVPYVGFIPLGFISITIIHIPVILGAIFLGWKSGILYGTAFGLVSLLKAATSPVTIMDPYFVNPAISVLPRLLFGFTAGILALLVFKNIINKNIKRVLLAVVAFLATAFHTLYVFIALVLFHPEFFTWEIASAFGLNMLFEALAAAILISVLYFALEKPFANRLLKYSNKEEVREND